MKYLWYAPFPNEMDGGAIVIYYQAEMMNLLEPMVKVWGVPKVPEELEANYLPWINFFSTNGNLDEIPRRMMQEQIPLATFFHIGRKRFEPIIDSIHNIGAKLVLWQTIHWMDDDVFESKRLNDFDSIVAPTGYAKRALMEVAKISHKKITTIPHGVNMRKFYPHKTAMRLQMGIPPEKKIILFTSRLSLWKGVHQLIPVFRPLIKDYDCHFVIRGGTFWGIEEGRKLDYIFSTLSARNRNIIYVPNWQSPAWMEELFASCDFFISPSGHEGFGVPLIEAMATKMPVVATLIPSHAEILGQSGMCGLLLEPTVKVGEVNKGQPIKIPNSDQIEGSLRWLLENPEESRVMAERGYRRAKKFFDLEKISRQWFDLYLELMPEGFDMGKEMARRLQA